MGGAAVDQNNKLQAAGSPVQMMLRSRAPSGMEGSHPVGTYSEGAPELDLALNFTPPDLGGQKESAGSGAAVQQPATLSPGPVDAAQALLALGKRRAAADEENEGAPGRTQSIQGQKIKKGLPADASQPRVKRPAMSSLEPESGDSCASAPFRPPAAIGPPQQHEIPQILLLPNANGIIRGRMLGSGTFGDVFEASLEGDHWPEWLRGLSLVVKVLQVHPSVGGRADRNRVYDEFILGCVRHPSLVGCLAFTQSPPFFALFERCNRGSLWDVFRGKRNSEDAGLLEAVRRNGIGLVVQLGQGVAHLHAQNLLHCDLHQKNVLFHHEQELLQLRVADFGLCSRLSDLRSHRLVRLQERGKYRKNRPFIAPELLLGGEFSKASDMWAVGPIAENILGVERWTCKPISGVCKVRLSARALRVLTACSSV